MNRLLGAGALALSLVCCRAQAQVIEFETNGLKYQTLTRSGVTVMFTHLGNHIHEYSIIQVAISNGSDNLYIVRPEDFTYVRPDGSVLIASSIKSVIDMLMQKGNSSDVVKLVTQYEATVYGNPHFKSTNGYEQRRQAALAMNGTKFKAAAAASAVAMVMTRLKPGDSTDGAVFFSTEGKPLSGGRVVVKTNSDVFEFKAE
ncbi:conserved exported hypothetical protein [Candidatus Sulfopaludibacter sp. SbA3]|nr:conserved exported hypothetical protein [Candidatus Sulfopaludibacter sp. SbA3]